MDFTLPPELVEYIKSLDTFIDTKITPLQSQDDNNRFFDHRREYARTDFENGGLPRDAWESLLAQATRLADEAGFWRFALPAEYGGKHLPPTATATGIERERETDPRKQRNATNLWMAVLREHLASRAPGLGLYNDLQTEHSVIGNFPDLMLIHHFGTAEQKRTLIQGRLAGKVRITFGLTEPDHGSDATHMETTGVEEVRNGVKGWRVKGRKKWQTGMHAATHCFVFARTAGKAGDAKGVTCFLVENGEGVHVESYEWTLNMPTDHATVTFNTWLPPTSILGALHDGLSIAQAFVHENRIRQAASSLGAAVYCINASVAYANARKPFGQPLSRNQGIQFPLVELATQAEMLRLLIRKTAWEMDCIMAEADAEIEANGASTTTTTTTKKALGKGTRAIEHRLGDKVSMCNYIANRLCTDAADRAIQVHGGNGYSRHFPFEHIWRHHRRYRITEGSEEIQMRKVGAYLFGFGGRGRGGGVAKL